MEVVLQKCSHARGQNSLYQSYQLSRMQAYSGRYDPQSKHERDCYYHYNYWFRKAFRESIANPKFVLIRMIGHGAFGMIYEGKCKKTQEKVAIKIELQNHKDANSLYQEFRILRHLQGV